MSSDLDSSSRIKQLDKCIEEKLASVVNNMTNIFLNILFLIPGVPWRVLEVPEK